MKRIIIVVISLALSGWIAGAAANPWKNEGGKSRYHSNDARYVDGFDRRTGRKDDRDRASHRRDHLPPAGKCRAWFLSRLPGC
jgi:hypothetical protein